MRGHRKGKPLPETETGQTKTYHQHRDWHDYISSVFTILTFMAALGAAIFAGIAARYAGQQTKLARDAVKAATQSAEAAKNSVSATNNSVTAANKAADAATKQAGTVDDTEKRQLRAYLGVIPGAIDNFGAPKNQILHYIRKKLWVHSSL
jgi:hypothetical protein